MMCRGQLISALLYADDAVIFAEDEELMRRGLDILAEWCEEWSMKINVEKFRVMHMRRKGVKRSDERFHVGGAAQALATHTSARMQSNSKAHVHTASS